MVWFLVLHIGALLVWAAALLYLPVMIGVSPHTPPDIDEAPQPYESVGRFLFTRVSTPAALVAIMSGTVVFLLNRTVDPWLIIKLTLVTALVICHALSGVLILRAENREQRSGIRILSGALAAVMCLLMIGIVWVVLAKPPEELLPWTS